MQTYVPCTYVQHGHLGNSKAVLTVEVSLNIHILCTYNMDTWIQSCPYCEGTLKYTHTVNIQHEHID